MKTKILIILLLITITLLFGCSSSGDSAVLLMLEDDDVLLDFMDEYPDYKTSIRAMTSSSVSRDFYFQNECDGVSKGDYYKVILTDEDSGERAFAFVDLDEGVVCSFLKQTNGVNVTSGTDNNTPCVETWECSDWMPSTCPTNGEQTRICSDTTYCGTELNMPSEEQDCNYIEVCDEAWTCTDWSDCINSSKTRTCAEDNNCGTITDKPIESGSCNLGCEPHWACSALNDCVDGTMTRTCVDDLNCGTTIGRPTLSYSCSDKNCQEFIADELFDDSIQINKIGLEQIDYILGEDFNIFFFVDYTFKGTTTKKYLNDFDNMELNLREYCATLSVEFSRTSQSQNCPGVYEAILSVTDGSTTEEIIKSSSFLLNDELQTITLNNDVNIIEIYSGIGNIEKLDMNVGDAAHIGLLKDETVTIGNATITFEGINVAVDCNIEIPAIFHYGSESEPETFSAFVDNSTSDISNSFSSQAEYHKLEVGEYIEVTGTGDYENKILRIEFKSAPTPGVGSQPYEAEFYLKEGSSTIQTIVEIVKDSNLKNELPILENVYVKSIGRTFGDYDQFVFVEVD